MKILILANYDVGLYKFRKELLEALLIGAVLMIWIMLLLSEMHILLNMGYRAMNLSKIKDKDTKANYKRLQQIYALPDMRSEEEKESDFANELW